MNRRVLVTLNATDHGGDVAFQVRERHLRLLTRAALLPVLAPGSLPPDDLEALLETCDAAYLPGGDYHPETLDEPERASAGRAEELGLPWDPSKVRLDLTVLRSCWRRGLPTLAICGGFQSMAVVHGGKLGASDNGSQDPQTEKIGLVPETLAAHIFGVSVEVNSFHKQVVERLGGELVAAGHTASGTIEAIEAPASVHPFWLGLQWHPELMDDLRPYRALSEAAAARASEA